MGRFLFVLYRGTNMYNPEKSPIQARECPRCHTPMQLQGELWRCGDHGLFFSYGPRLLVRADRNGTERAPLMPWQTLAEEALTK